MLLNYALVMAMRWTEWRIRGFAVPFLNRFTREDCNCRAFLCKRAIYYFAILNVNLSEKERRMQRPLNMQQNCAIERRRTRAKIEGLIVLWVIFNLSRLYPSDKPLHTAPRSEWERESENERQLKACKRCFNNIMDRRGMCNDMKFTSETLSLFLACSDNNDY